MTGHQPAWSQAVRLPAVGCPKCPTERRRYLSFPTSSFYYSCGITLTLINFVWKRVTFPFRRSWAALGQQVGTESLSEETGWHHQQEWHRTRAASTACSLRACSCSELSMCFVSFNPHSNLCHEIIITFILQLRTPSAF